jgi:hypothetical protein
MRQGCEIYVLRTFLDGLKADHKLYGSAQATGEMIMETPFADDVLHGAEEIAGFLYGDAKQRRRVF